MFNKYRILGPSLEEGKQHWSAALVRQSVCEIYSVVDKDSEPGN